MGIMELLDTKEMEALGEIVDPYYYLDRYANMPKMLINAGGDEFLMPDDTRYIFCTIYTYFPLLFLLIFFFLS